VRRRRFRACRPIRPAEVQREADLPPEQFVPGWIPALLTAFGPQRLVDEVSAMVHEFHPAGAPVAARLVGRLGYRDMPPTIAVPTLLLYGDADARSPVHVGADLRARIPESTLVVLPGAPDASNIEQPEEFDGVLSGWPSSHSTLTGGTRPTPPQTASAPFFAQQCITAADL
jgi:pimeloyl-ACP methyl ester carboxylesterase